jgi:hypothetical protein
MKDTNGNDFTFFDWLKQIQGNKKPWSSFTEEHHKQFNTYLIHRYISMYEPYIEIVNYAQSIPQNDKEKIYQFYCDMIPKNNIWLKYIKSTKKKINEDVLKYISEYYMVSFGEAEDYIYILGKSGVESILQKYGVEEKQIKKLIKEIK